MNDISLFNGPPSIPEGLSDVVLYQLKSKEFNNRLKSLTFISIEAIGALFIIGLLWITVDWVKIVITAIAIALSLTLLFLIRYILY